VLSDQFLARVSQASAHATITRFHAPTESWIIIVIDDVTRGPAVGGTRLKVYRSPLEGLEDALRLSKGMTDKWAALGISRGGGKGVLVLSRPLEGAERRDLLRTYADVIQSLHGGFATGPDLGISLEDIGEIYRQTKFVHGIHSDGTVEDPGPHTARGVRVSIEAALEEVFGSAELQGRQISIEGLGSVGAPLARECAELGAKLLLSDLIQERAEALASELGGTVLDPTEALAAECDVYAPCAVGGTLHRDSAPKVKARIIAGSANNQLSERSVADLLHERGILYVPDFVANGGGALAFALFSEGITDRQELLARMSSIGERLRVCFQDAKSRNESPLRIVEGWIGHADS